jgi:hypothetical protein
MYDDVLKTIINKLDKLQDDITDIKVEQAKQGCNIAQNTEDLSEHIMRTNLLEDKLDDHVEEDEKTISAIRDRVSAVESPLTVRQLVKNIMAVIGALALITGFVFELLRILGKV